MDDKAYEPPAFTEHFKAMPPGTLYHYTGQAGLLGIVESKELWATKIQYMNDASEFGLALRMARNELEAIINTSKFPADKPAGVKLQESLRGLEDINICASCFCEDGDLLSQWRGYAGGQHGYAIGFGTDELAEISHRSGFVLGRCIYDRALQRKIVQEAVAYCLQNEYAIPFGRRWGYHGPLADILFRCGVFFKDASFKDEKEWRLVSPTLRYDADPLRFRVGTSMVTPFYALSIATDGELPIQHIVVGPCPHMELSKFSVTSLLMRYGNEGPLRGEQVALGSIIPYRDW